MRIRCITKNYKCEPPLGPEGAGQLPRAAAERGDRASSEPGVSGQGRVLRPDAQALTALPDSLVGTDSHTTMINGLGVVGWGVGGIEAEAIDAGPAALHADARSRRSSN